MDLKRDLDLERGVKWSVSHASKTCIGGCAWYKIPEDPCLGEHKTRERGQLRYVCKSRRAGRNRMHPRLLAC